MYEQDDKIILLIKDNYSILQIISSFGITLGFGDKTVKEVCTEQNVDTNTFLTIVNFSINGYRDTENDDKLSVPTLMQYLKASHDYFLDYQLPFMKRELQNALDPNDNLCMLIMKLYDEYAQAISAHMKYEEKNVFPYVDSLLHNRAIKNFDIETYSRHHSQIDNKLCELKDIIIKYMPIDKARNNRLTAVLFYIYNNEMWLTRHAKVEDEIFVPAIKMLEQKSKQRNVSKKIAHMIGHNSETAESLSDREKDVIVCLVQGMANKEIAEHLYISINTVITHRRNISRKLQIHSTAGLTIYAIVNNLIDITNVKI